MAARAVREHAAGRIDGEYRMVGVVALHPDDCRIRGRDRQSGANIYIRPTVTVIQLRSGRSMHRIFFRIRITPNFYTILRIQRNPLHNRMIGGENDHVLLVPLDVAGVVVAAFIAVHIQVAIRLIVAQARVLSHDDRDSIGIGRRHICRATAAGDDHQHCREQVV